ncbi:MAG: hypothetical protein FI707_08390 [SAR202 cluster bacterium]|jgi:hypothetical protein|nr:hypothetical protein [SAR202 cluster bacterium]HAL47174.1 hypothetical protein [Dehalococcoidia bacterium]MDP6665698.1 hypothetical protein [SAR202 cluster bacterium]MDP6798377.1 hypothetical protein [SAR202 cluster bacterium]MQG59406.1 hypothetical protein [SAR202 cluster bacterium]|tara:strand:+ start:5799 stop:6434 length:636 start_codon:yes stop_codon:yes gene_type:complete
MNNKLFVVLIVGMLVVGLGMGGAFAGGVAYERGGEETPLVVAAPELPSPSGTSYDALPVDADQAAALRDQLQSGNLSPEQLQEIRQQFQGRGGASGPGGGGFGGAGGFAGGYVGSGNLIGTVDAVADNVITLNTAQGPLQVTLGPDTVIRDFVQVNPEDLVIDASVTVTGERSEDGGFDAVSIFITPEDLGLGGFSGFGGFRGGRGQVQSP